ncbi:MAG: PAS domain S-box protein [Planctomycetaceae bacterium]
MMKKDGAIMGGEHVRPAPWTIRSGLCQDAVAVPHNQPISKVIEDIARARPARIVALNEHAVVGVISSDIVRNAPLDATLEQLFPPAEFICIDAELLLSEAEQHFRDHRIETIAVCDRHGAYAGIITRSSILAAAVAETESLRTLFLRNETGPQQDIAIEFDLASSDENENEENRLALEIALKSTEARYQAILEAQPECVKLTDTKGKLLEMNPAGLRIIEADSPEQVLGLNTLDLVNPPFKDEFRDWEKRVLNGERATIVFEATGLKGTRKWMESIGTPLRNAAGDIEAILAVSRDITERIFAGQQLQENEQRLRKIFNGIPYYLTLFTVDGDLSMVNASALESPGFSPDKLCGKKIWETDWINHDPSVAEQIQTAFIDARQGKSSRFDTRIKMSTGQIMQLEVTVHPVCDESGNVREILGAGVDITKRVQAEEQTRRLSDELAHATRLSTLGEMAANIAHELNQPLTAVVNYTFTAQDLVAKIDFKGKSECVHFLQLIEEQSLRAGQIIRGIQQLVRKTVSHRSTVDLHQVIEEVLTLLHAEFYQHNIELVTNFAADLPFIRVDSVQIQQVLLNLLRNSIDSLSQVSQDRRIELTTIQRDSQIHILVHDTGPGVPENLVDKLLDPFFTTKDDGLGLGLSISKRIVDAHGGELCYEPRLEQGATFRISLPIT